MNAPYRVVLSDSTTTTLKALTQKPGLSANILSRFAMLVSFEIHDDVATDIGKPGLVINRTTLFGDLETFIMSAYAISGGKSGEQGCSKELSAHIARGAAYLNIRTESLTDFLDVILSMSKIV